MCVCVHIMLFSKALPGHVVHPFVPTLCCDVTKKFFFSFFQVHVYAHYKSAYCECSVVCKPQF